MTRKLCLLCYDISDPARLRTALRLARRLASGGQKSVHECWLRPQDIQRLQHELATLIEPLEDRVLLIQPDPGRPSFSLGRARAASNPSLIMVRA